MKLLDHIKAHYDGNVSEFARTNGFVYQQVQKNLERGYIHILRVDGELYQVAVKRPINEPQS